MTSAPPPILVLADLSRTPRAAAAVCAAVDRVLVHSHHLTEYAVLTLPTSSSAARPLRHVSPRSLLASRHLLLKPPPSHLPPPALSAMSAAAAALLAASGDASYDSFFDEHKPPDRRTSLVVFAPAPRSDAAFAAFAPPAPADSSHTRASPAPPPLAPHPARLNLLWVDISNAPSHRTAPRFAAWLAAQGARLAPLRAFTLSRTLVPARAATLALLHPPAAALPHVTLDFVLPPAAHPAALLFRARLSSVAHLVTKHDHPVPSKVTLVPLHFVPNTTASDDVLMRASAFRDYPRYVSSEPDPAPSAANFAGLAASLAAADCMLAVQVFESSSDKRLRTGYALLIPVTPVSAVLRSITPAALGLTAEPSFDAPAFASWEAAQPEQLPMAEECSVGSVPFQRASALLPHLHSNPPPVPKEQEDAARALTPEQLAHLAEATEFRNVSPDPASTTFLGQCCTHAQHFSERIDDQMAADSEKEAAKVLQLLQNKVEQGQYEEEQLAKKTLLAAEKEEATPVQTPDQQPSHDLQNENSQLLEIDAAENDAAYGLLSMEKTVPAPLDTVLGPESDSIIIAQLADGNSDQPVKVTDVITNPVSEQVENCEQALPENTDTNDNFAKELSDRLLTVCDERHEQNHEPVVSEDVGDPIPTEEEDKSVLPTEPVQEDTTLKDTDTLPNDHQTDGQSPRDNDSDADGNDDLRHDPNHHLIADGKLGNLSHVACNVRDSIQLLSVCTDGFASVEEIVHKCIDDLSYLSKEVYEQGKERHDVRKAVKKLSNRNDTVCQELQGAQTRILAREKETSEKDAGMSFWVATMRALEQIVWLSSSATFFLKKKKKSAQKRVRKIAKRTSALISITQVAGNLAATKPESQRLFAHCFTSLFSSILTPFKAGWGSTSPADWLTAIIAQFDTDNQSPHPTDPSCTSPDRPPNKKRPLSALDDPVSDHDKRKKKVSKLSGAASIEDAGSRKKKGEIKLGDLVSQLKEKKAAASTQPRGRFSTVENRLLTGTASAAPAATRKRERRVDSKRQKKIAPDPAPPPAPAPVNEDEERERRVKLLFENLHKSTATVARTEEYDDVPQPGTLVLGTPPSQPMKFDIATFQSPEVSNQALRFVLEDSVGEEDDEDDIFKML